MEKSLTALKFLSILIKDKDINIMYSYLKKISKNNYEFLCIISDDILLSDKSNELYTASFEIEKILSTDNFNVSFSFMGYCDWINEEMIICDGYNIKLIPKEDNGFEVINLTINENGN